MTQNRNWARLIRTGLAALAMSGAVALQAPAALAQDFPTGPVTIVIPYAAGGTTDVVSRQIAAYLQAKWGQPVIVDNKPGAGTTIAMQAVAQAAPDGHTIVMNESAIATNEVLRSDLPYDLGTDLKPVLTVTEWPLTLAVNADLGVKTLDELVEKSRTTQLAYGAFGPGTAPHLVMELFKGLTGADITTVQYNGVAPTFQGLAAGEVQMTVMGAGAAKPHVEAGRMVALALEYPSPLLPGVPSFAEAGYPDMRAPAWWAIMAPGGTPDEIVAQLNAALNEAIHSPEIKTFLEDNGYTVVGGTPEDLSKRIQESIDLWGPLVESAGITMK